MKWKIPLFKTYSDEEDVEAVAKVIRRGTYWATGPEIEEFERTIAKYIGKKYAIAFNSGTSALHALLLAYNLKGSEVIVPSFTFISTANAILLAGGRPIFAESEPETFGLDADDVKKRITDKTKAVITVHYGGCVCKDIKKLKQICTQNKILLIEDAAESLGATAYGMRAGAFGDAAMLSFCQNKVISTGEGGMVVTDSKEIYNKMILLRSHGRVEAKNTDYFSSSEDDDYIEPGYNLRMPTMVAALGQSQMAKIEQVIKLRKENAQFLNKELADIEQIMCPATPKGFNHVYQLYTITLQDNGLRDGLHGFLKDKGIMTKIYFNPVHLKTLYKRYHGYKEGNLPATEALSQRVLTLPMYPDLSQDDLNYMVSAVKDFCKKNEEA